MARGATYWAAGTSDPRLHEDMDRAQRVLPGLVPASQFAYAYRYAASAFSSRGRLICKDRAPVRMRHRLLVRVALASRRPAAR